MELSVYRPRGLKNRLRCLRQIWSQNLRHFPFDPKVNKLRQQLVCGFKVTWQSRRKLAVFSLFVFSLWRFSLRKIYYIFSPWRILGSNETCSPTGCLWRWWEGSLLRVSHSPVWGQTTWCERHSSCSVTNGKSRRFFCCHVLCVTGTKHIHVCACSVCGRMRKGAVSNIQNLEKTAWLVVWHSHWVFPRHGTAAFLGPARRSQGGLVESRLRRHCRLHGGPPRGDP